MPIATPHTSIEAQTRFGSRKGNFSKSVPGGKSLGKFLHGWARVPPRAGPRIDLFKALAQLGVVTRPDKVFTYPRHHTNGMMEKDRATYSERESCIQVNLAIR